MLLRNIDEEKTQQTLKRKKKNALPFSSRTCNCSTTLDKRIKKKIAKEKIMKNKQINKLSFALHKLLC